MLREKLEDRIVELVFCPWQELPNELKKLGLDVEAEEEGEIIINNGYQKYGLYDSIEPTIKAVIISGAISGSIRIGYHFPNLMQKVKKKWRENDKRSTTSL
jgi:hypothetical protein